MNLFSFRLAVPFLSSDPDLLPLRTMVSSEGRLTISQILYLKSLRLTRESVVRVRVSVVPTLLNFTEIRLISFSNSLGQLRVSESGSMNRISL